MWPSMRVGLLQCRQCSTHCLFWKRSTRSLGLLKTGDIDHNDDPEFITIFSGMVLGSGLQEPLQSVRFMTIRHFTDAGPKVADLYCDVSECGGTRVVELIPGLALVMVTTLAAAFLAQRYGAPLSLMSLLLALSLNFLNHDRRLQPGLRLVTGPLLRLAIVLLGAQITLGQIGSFGWKALVILAILVLLTIAAAQVAARAFGLGARFGMLAGGAVAICGASAGVALAAVLGRNRETEGQLALVLVGISAFSAAAMVFYPAIAHAVGLSDLQAGFLMGASIHDVAQSVSAGYSFSKEAGDVAAIFKIGRVTLLAPVLLVTAWAFRQAEGVAPTVAPVPWFLAGFCILVMLNSAGFVPPPMSDLAHLAAVALVSCAVAATGIQAPMQSLTHLGVRPFLVIAMATATIFMLALAVAWSGILKD